MALTLLLPPLLPLLLLPLLLLPPLLLPPLLLPPQSTMLITIIPSSFCSAIQHRSCSASTTAPPPASHPSPPPPLRPLRPSPSCLNPSSIAIATNSIGRWEENFSMERGRKRTDGAVDGAVEGRSAPLLAAPPVPLPALRPLPPLPLPSVTHSLLSTTCTPRCCMDNSWA
jgi:hypothetical protein